MVQRTQRRKGRQTKIIADYDFQASLYTRTKWPTHIRVQRHKQIMKIRMKIPPLINQFNFVLDKTNNKKLYDIITKYKPYSTLEKQNLMLEEAKKLTKDEIKKIKKTRIEKPNQLVVGLKKVTRLIELQKCQLVVIANDVDPLELVLWMPTLCKKMNVPYCIVKGRARLGQLSNAKNCSCLAVVSVDEKDQSQFEALVKAIKLNFNDKYEQKRRMWGGCIISDRAREKIERRKRIKEEEEAKLMTNAFAESETQKEQPQPEKTE